MVGCLTPLDKFITPTCNLYNIHAPQCFLFPQSPHNISPNISTFIPTYIYIYASIFTSTKNIETTSISSSSSLLAPMATFAIHFSCFFLIALSISGQTQARESKFFSKYVHLSTNSFVTIPTSTNLKKDVPSSPTPTQAPITSHISGVPASAPIGEEYGFSPAPAPAPITLGVDYSPAPAPTITLGAEYSPAPAPAPSENEIPYYGLYGKNTNDEEEEEFTTENPEELNNNREAYTYNNGDLSNNGFWTSNHRSYYDTNNGYDFNSGYKSEPQGMSDTRIADNGRYYYNNEHETYSPSGRKSEPEGMSDTRLVNNGKYYYNVEQENYSPSGRENNNEEGYYYGGNYKKSKYEFDSMEEYEKQQGFADVQQDFINP